MRLPLVTIGLTVTLLGCHLVGFDAGLRRDAVLAGEEWRIWTGHLVHFGPGHLVGDVLAFPVWSALVEQRSRRALVTTLIATTTAVSLWVLLACPEVRHYRGISAVDAALAVEVFVLGLSGGFSETHRALTLICAAGLLGFVLKTGAELGGGHALLAPDLGEGVRLLPSVHVIGASVGACVGLVFGRDSRPRTLRVKPEPRRTNTHDSLMISSSTCQRVAAGSTR